MVIHPAMQTCEASSLTGKLIPFGVVLLSYDIISCVGSLATGLFFRP